MGKNRDLEDFTWDHLSETMEQSYTSVDERTWNDFKERYHRVELGQGTDGVVYTDGDKAVYGHVNQEGPVPLVNFKVMGDRAAVFDYLEDEPDSTPTVLDAATGRGNVSLERGPDSVEAHEIPVEDARHYDRFSGVDRIE